MKSNMFYIKRNPAGIAEAHEFSSGDYALAQARIVDELLTEYSIGYRNQAFIGDKHFPVVKMDKRAGRIPTFGEEIFKLYVTTRALGAPVQHISTQEGYTQASLSEHSLGFDIDRQILDEWAGTVDQLLLSKQTQVSAGIGLDRELQQAQLATTPGNYASGLSSTPSLKWSANGDAYADIDGRITDIVKACGQRPVVMSVSYGAYLLLKRNKAILDRIRYQGTQGAPAQVTPLTLQALFDIPEVNIGMAIVGTGVEGGVNQTALTHSFVWDYFQTNCVALAVKGVGWMQLSFGYTYQKTDSPIVESWWDNKTKSQQYDEQHFFDALAVSNKSGGLLYGMS